MFVGFFISNQRIIADFRAIKVMHFDLMKTTRLNNERVVQINFIYLSAVLTKESILFQSRVNFFSLSCY